MIMDDGLKLTNWRRESGLLSWGMEIPDDQNEGPAAMTQRCAIESSRLLGDFATVSQAFWTTESYGEDAAVQDFSVPGAPPEERMAQVALADLVEMVLWLDLTVAYPVDPVERSLRNDGALYCEYEQCRPSGKERTDGPGISLLLDLDVDIYARRTYTAASENRILADLNAPRLNRYLRVLQAHFGTQFTYIEYEGDQSQIDNNGFIGHDVPPA